MRLRGCGFELALPVSFTLFEADCFFGDCSSFNCCPLDDSSLLDRRFCRNSASFSGKGGGGLSGSTFGTSLMLGISSFLLPKLRGVLIGREREWFPVDIGALRALLGGGTGTGLLGGG
jgi:hypothetical protein